MKRGELITVSVSGDYGKPRPAVVIQSDALAGSDSVLVCLITSTVRDAPIYRLTVEPDSTNGLKDISQIMVDKVFAIARNKCGKAIGHLNDTLLVALNRMLAVVVGIAG